MRVSRVGISAAQWRFFIGRIVSPSGAGWYPCPEWRTSSIVEPMRFSIRRLYLAVVVLNLWAAPGALQAQGNHLGTVRFPNSGAPAAQRPFIRGVLLLHSFE